MRERLLSRNSASTSFVIRKLFLVVVLLLGSSAIASAQRDPGPRSGPSDAGGPIRGLSPEEEKLFWSSWERFKKIYSVTGSIEKGVGLGPRFNGNGCAQCHAQPAAGGSSSSPRSAQVRRLVMRDQYAILDSESNPQVLLASLDRAPGGSQSIPSFIVVDGPIRVARFIKKPDGTPDGGVHEIYTIAGRVDARDCNLSQPNFDKEVANNNVVFRIPTPTFGAGLIEAVPDSALIANLNLTVVQRRALGIAGRFNRTANDGTISRFGWKAQNKSLLIFAAESQNVEMGVTNEAFPDKRDQTPGCLFNALPEDRIKAQLPPNETYGPSAFSSDAVSFATFMRLLAPPTASTRTASESSGQVLFAQVGCTLCHSADLETGESTFSGMSHIKIHPYSDFALHHMGPDLADHISQGLASGDEFRTTPLWGLGQRLFFIHDGRTTDLQAAIQAHASSDSHCRTTFHFTGDEVCGSEANVVILRFNALSSTQKQDILNFLRSL